MTRHRNVSERFEEWMLMALELECSVNFQSDSLRNHSGTDMQWCHRNVVDQLAASRGTIARAGCEGLIRCSECNARMDTYLTIPARKKVAAAPDYP